MKIKVNIIAAVAENGAIGKDGKLLWHLSEDLKYFKKVTLGCPVIMGRKTFESIGKPLPGRCNIVVSRHWDNPAPEGIVPASSLDEALSIASLPMTQGIPPVSGERTEQDCFVIGGGEIYRQAMPMADRLYITEVHTKVDDADTFFPAIDKAQWKEISRSDRQRDEKSGLDFDFVVYER